MNQNLNTYINDIVANLKANYSPEKIILFGSYCDGTFTKDSDIDLLLVKETDKHPIWRRVEARKASGAKVPMDILVYTPNEIKKLIAEKSFFISDILKKGKILYERLRPTLPRVTLGTALPASREGTALAGGGSSWRTFILRCSPAADDGFI